MNNFPAIKEKIITLARATGVSAVYLVGVNDGLALSDYDLAVVSENQSPSFKKQWQKLDPAVDLRRYVNINDFKIQSPYWPHVHYELLFGQELRPPLDPEQNDKLNLIKLASLFFTSFLRNYYRLLDSSDQAEILRNLNDWRYVEFFLPAVAPEFKPLIQEIKTARAVYPNNKISDLQDLLKRAIDESWRLVEILNGRLKEEFENIYPSYFSTYREITIFVPGDSTACRRLTEKYLFFAKRSKIIFLPLGFQFVFSSNFLVRSFFRYNTPPEVLNLFFYLKMMIKRLAGIFLLISSKNNL